MLKPNFYLSMLGRSYPAFRILGAAGYILGAGVGFLLAGQQELSLAVVFLLSLTSAATCLGLIWITKIITGRETIVYYHHEIAIVVVSALVLYAIGQPVLPYLDIVVLGIGSMLCIGRWGCFMAGCCHGKPCQCSFGAIYGPSHTREGFPAYFIGLPIFPVPLLESAGVFLVVLAGVFMVFSEFAPGSVLVGYTVIYGAIRFILEYLRGDPARPYLWHFSEAQWTTLVLLGITLFLSVWGQLPLFVWHAWIAGSLALLALFTVIFYTFWGKSNNAFFRPRHIDEIAQGVERLSVQHPIADSNKMRSIPVICTSLGLVLSRGVVRENGSTYLHYTLSRNCVSLVVTDQIASKVADLLARIRHRDHFYSIGSNYKGIHHIVFQKKKPLPDKMVKIDQTELKN